MSGHALVEGVAHVGVAVSYLEEALVFFSGGLGLEVSRVEPLPEQGITAALLPLAGSDIELLVPDSAQSGIARFLERRGQGLHHVAFETPDVDAAFGLLKSRGVDLLDDGPRRGLSGMVFFLHPRALGGVLVEMEEPGEAAGIGRPSVQEAETRLERIVVAAEDTTEAAGVWRRVLELKGTKAAAAGPLLLALGETHLELREATGAVGLAGLVLSVDDMEAAVLRLRDRGCSLSEVQTVDGAPVVDIDRRSAHGVPVRLVERLE